MIHLSSLQPSFIRRLGKDPRTDWAILLTATIILIVLSIFLGFNRYESVSQRLSEASKTPAPGARSMFDSKKLENTLEEFSRRATVRTDLMKSYPGPADPSI